MKNRRHEINGKFIDIYDGVFSYAERNSMYAYALNSYYQPSRQARGSLEKYEKYHSTLKAGLSISDVLNFSFFKNSWLQRYLKDKDLRVNRAYINLCTASDTYQFHIDSFTPGTPTMLCFLNLDWDPVWEGETHFSDEDGQDTVVSAGFLPGRLIVFDGAIPHKSSQPGPLAENYRFTLAVKLSARGDANWGQSICLDDFMFGQTTPMTNKESVALNFLRPITENIQHSGASFLNHLSRTFVLLKKFNVPETVCLAGLFHSVYGTEFFNAGRITTEEKVIELIGEEANELVKMFSRPNRLDNLLNNRFNLPSDKNLALLYIHYANEIEQAYRSNTEDFSHFAAIKNKIETLRSEKLNWKWDK